MCYSRRHLFLEGFHLSEMLPHSACASLSKLLLNAPCLHYNVNVRLLSSFITMAFPASFSDGITNPFGFYSLLCFQLTPFLMPLQFKILMNNNKKVINIIMKTKLPRRKIKDLFNILPFESFSSEIQWRAIGKLLHKSPTSQTFVRKKISQTSH